MIVLFLGLVIILIVIRKSNKRKQLKPMTAIYQVSAAELRRREKAYEMEQKKKASEQKAAHARELACMEIENIDAQRVLLMELYDAIEAERDSGSITQSRKNSLTRQLITLEERLYKLDARKAKAYNDANVA